MEQTVEKVTFRNTFGWKDADARGRTVSLIYTTVEAFITEMATGIFYTGFLTGYNIDLVKIGIISFIPYLANLFALFAPAILTKTKHRKVILAVLKLLYYVTIFIGITVMPQIVTSENGRLVGIVILTFVANIFNIIATAGYSAWHISFVPEEKRSYYFSTMLFMSSLFPGIFLLLSSVITDALSQMADKQLTFLVYLRYFAFALAALDLIILFIPKEVDYPVAHAPRLTDIITIPLKNKKFMLTMVVVFFWQFANFVYSKFLQAYLLENIGMTYLFYNIIFVCYFVFFIIFARFWQERIRKSSWFLVFALSLIIVAPLQILYGFIQPVGYMIFALIVRLPQHFAGVGHNTAFSNFQYINMGPTNRTCYTSFYQIIYNLGALAGLAFGTVFTDFTQDLSYTIFGYTYRTGTPILTSLAGVVEVFIIIFVLVFRKKLEPDEAPENSRTAD